jgi:hypothetical protein
MFWDVEVSWSVIGSPKCGRELDWETSFLLAVLFCPLSNNAVCSALHSRLDSAVACPGAVLTRSSIVLGLARIGPETVLKKTTPSRSNTRSRSCPVSTHVLSPYARTFPATS